MTTTTTTSPETHLVVVQFEDIDSGYRFWTKPMTEAEAEVTIKETTANGYYAVDDYDSAAACVCAECVARRAEWDAILNRA